MASGVLNPLILSALSEHSLPGYYYHVLLLVDTLWRNMLPTSLLTMWWG